MAERNPDAVLCGRLFRERFNGAAPAAIRGLNGRGRVADIKEEEFRPMKRRMILALAPALFATAAVAQPPGAPHGPHGAPTAEMKAHHEAMAKQHMDDLKIVLRLCPD